MIWKNQKEEYLEAYQILGFGYIDATAFIVLEGRDTPMPISIEAVENYDMDIHDFIAFPNDPALSETFNMNFVVWDEDSFKQEHELVGLNHSGAVH